MTLLKTSASLLCATLVSKQQSVVSVQHTVCSLLFRVGYLVRPTSVQFYQGQSDHLNDRVIFRRPQPGEVIDPLVTKHGDDGWVYELLCP